MLVVAALGGNALLRRGEPADAKTQRLNIRDPAFQHPSKPIGPIYGRAAAERLAHELHWTVAPDGEHWRRVVPSPEPQRIVEPQTIRTLVEAACRFASQTGKIAAIGALADAPAVLAGRAGTHIVSESGESPLAASEDVVGRLEERAEELDEDISTTSRLAGHPLTAKHGPGSDSRATGATER